jgi:hypothetical protein
MASSAPEGAGGERLEIENLAKRALRATSHDDASAPL